MEDYGLRLGEVPCRRQMRRRLLFVAFAEELLDPGFEAFQAPVDEDDDAYGYE